MALPVHAWGLHTGPVSGCDVVPCRVPNSCCSVQYRMVGQEQMHTRTTLTEHGSILPSCSHDFACERDPQLLSWEGEWREMWGERDGECRLRAHPSPLSRRRIAMRECATSAGRIQSCAIYRLGARNAALGLVPSRLMHPFTMACRRRVGRLASLVLACPLPAARWCSLALTYRTRSAAHGDIATLASSPSRAI